MKKNKEIIIAQTSLLICLIFFFIMIYINEGHAETPNNTCKESKAVILISSEGAEGFGHSAILIQEYESKEWFYFSWQTPKVVFVKVPDEKLKSFDTFNEWIINEDPLINYESSYDSTLVLRGDFSASLEKAESIFLDYVFSTGQEVNELELSLINRNYFFSFIFNNCLDNIYDILIEGRINCEYPFENLVQKPSIIPNVAKHQLTSQLNHEEFW